MALKEKILDCLRAHSGYVSGEELSERLGVSRTAVWKNIKTLRAGGYGIESVTNRGYRLTSCPDVITPEEITPGLDTKVIGKSIFCFDQIDSTNEEAKRRAVSDAPDGSLFVADQQLGGKGRLGRAWASPAGTGLWFSILLRAGMLPARVTGLTLLAGLAVCRAVRAFTGCEARIKWPNDIVIGSKKVCGILTELSAEIDRVNYVVVGIGVNVNTPSFPEELRKKATSLLLETGAPVSRTGLLREILRRFEEILAQEKRDGAALLEEYRRRCVSLNRKVGFTREGRALEGVATGIASGGELIVSCEGKEILVSSGEVTVQGIYGQK